MKLVNFCCAVTHHLLSEFMLVWLIMVWFSFSAFGNFVTIDLQLNLCATEMPGLLQAASL
jgi:hypothetical protein